MNGLLDHLFLLPDAPGDLVCSRQRLLRASRLGATGALHRERLRPLLAGLSLRSLPWEGDLRRAAFDVAPLLSETSAVYDLQWTDESASLAQALSTRTVGIHFPDVEGNSTTAKSHGTPRGTRLTRLCVSSATSLAMRTIAASTWRHGELAGSHAPVSPRATAWHWLQDPPAWEQ